MGMINRKLRDKRICLQSQAGFGMVEAAVAAVVFVLFVGLGMKAFHAVSVNYGEAKRTQGITDIVSNTAEMLSTLGLRQLTDASKGYMDWSAAEVINGKGDFYRYRVVPNPTIGGRIEADVVSLEIQVGSMSGGTFTSKATHTTLVAPSLADFNYKSNDDAGSAMEASQSAFESHLKTILAAKVEAGTENPLYLDPTKCYKPEECCDYIRDEVNAGFTLHPTDGLPEKCNYRCLQRSGMNINEWQGICGVDICSAIPWRSASECRAQNFAEGTFEAYLCNACYPSPPCEGCCDALKNAIRSGRPYIPTEEIAGTENCPSACYEQLNNTGWSGQIDMNFWGGVCGGKTELCSMAPMKSWDDCCNANKAGMEWGSVSAGICEGCGLVGSGKCQEWKCLQSAWLNNVDCKNMSRCGEAPNTLQDRWLGWMGNLYQKCKTEPECLTSNCYVQPTIEECCNNYFLLGNTGERRYTNLCPAMDAKQCCNVLVKGVDEYYCDGAGGQYSKAHPGQNDWECTTSPSRQCQALNYCGKDQAFKPTGAPKTCSQSSSGSGSSSSSGSSTSSPQPPTAQQIRDQQIKDAQQSGGSGSSTSQPPTGGDGSTRSGSGSGNGGSNE